MHVLLKLVLNYSVSIANINREGNEISPDFSSNSRGKKTAHAMIHSDEEHSLVTSEPPLEPNCDLGEFASPANFITVVEATDSPVEQLTAQCTHQMELPLAEV